MQYQEPLFRPPAEAESLIFQAAYGCPHNSCKFCGMYKTVRYRLRNPAELRTEIEDAGRNYPETHRVFLADGDVMALPFNRLKEILDELNNAFPRLARVNLYANGSSVAMKSDEELSELRARKLNTLYIGLESGSQAVLDRFSKTESVEEMTASVLRAGKLGFKCSLMILLGLGGRDLRADHIAKTVQILNRMNPALLSALRFIPIPGLPLPGGYEPVTEYEAVSELREIISGLNLKHTVFRANHSSNPIPLAGRLPADREKLLAELKEELSSGILDREGPGIQPAFL